MSVRVGSPQPKVQPFVTPGTPKPVESKALAQVSAVVTSPVAAGDVDAFLRARHAAGQQRGLLPSLSALLSGAPKGIKEEASQLQQQLSAAVAELSEVYRDGLVTEPELTKLGNAKQRLDAVAALFAPAILNMLPRETRERLQNNLLAPVDALRDAADRRHGRVVDGVIKNLQAVQANPTPEYGWLDVGVLAKHGGSIAGPDRYAPGDLVSVPRSDGTATLGVVSSASANNVSCEFLNEHGQLASKDIGAAALIAANPLKIGDCIDTSDGRLWVTGTGAAGLTGLLEGPSGRKHVDVGYLQGLAHSVDQQLAAMRAAARAPATTAPPTPATTAAANVETKVLVAAGGFESSKPDELRGATVSGALFTYRGIGYADYNEDGAVLGVIAKGKGIEHETGFTGAFDQAGGMGHVKSQTGAASLIAAKRFDEAARKIAEGGSAETLLKGAVAEANQQVNALGVGAATTFAAAVVRNGVAHVVNCGDSAVMIFDKNGKLKGATEAHNLGDIMAKQLGDPNAGLHVANVITACIGGDNPQADYSRFAVAKGDVIVCVSDGVADANLAAQKKDFADGKPWSELNGDKTTREIGVIVAAQAAKGPAAITQAIIDYATAQVESGKGKRDNVTATVMTVT